MEESSTKPIVHILVAVCGVALWLDTEGIINELPVMINYAPEGWRLNSYANLCIAVASPIALVIVLLVNTCKRQNYKHFACSALVNQIVQLIVLSFVWNKTLVVAGESHSVGLFLVALVLGCSDRSYAIIFLSILQTLKSNYVASFFVGEGIGMLISPVLAFIQGSGKIKCEAVPEDDTTYINGSWINTTVYTIQASYKDPRFSVQVYLLVLASIAVLPLVSFILLNWNPLCLAAIADSKRDIQVIEYDEGASLSEDNLLLPKGSSTRSNSGLFTDCITSYCRTTSIKKHFKNAPAWNVLLLVAFVQMQLFAFPFTVGTYYSLPYGHNVFHLSITIGNVAVAMASITGHFFSVTSWYVIGGITLLSTSLSTYIIVIASLSPSPPLAGQLIGTVITVVVWCVQGYSLAYLKLCLAKLVHEKGTSLAWFGVAMEIGFLVGNITAFILIGILKLFKEKSFC